MLNIAESITANNETSTTDGLFAPANGREVARIKNWLESRFKAAASLNSDIITETIELTPAQAEYILAMHNTGNRPIRKSHVSDIARSMTEGRFLLTSQGLAFSKDKALIDGQHRLAACVASGMVVSFRVSFGDEQDNFAVFDTGSKRTAGDVLSLKDVPNANVVASAARYAFIQDRNYISISQGARTLRPGNDEINEFVEREGKFLIPAASDAARIAKALRCPASSVALGMYRIRKHSRFTTGMADFVENVINPDCLPAKSPILTLRDGLMTKQFGNRAHTANRALQEAAALINAWNGTVRKRKVRINWDTSKPFPMPE
jgi:hypothetical protein